MVYQGEMRHDAEPGNECLARPTGAAQRGRHRDPRSSSQSTSAAAHCWLLLLFSVALAAVCTPVRSQGKLDADTLKTFGGAYMVNCADSSSPKATVLADALVFEQGSRRIVGRNVKAAPSYFGQNMPPEYRTALLSEVGNEQLLFVLHEDRSGYYLTLDGDAKTIAAIGKPLASRKFRRCNAAPKPAQATSPAAPRRYAMHELSAAGLLMDPQAKAAYYKALGPLVREPWLAQLDGPSPQNKQVKVAGTDFILASACKNRDCGNNSTVLLYSAARNVVHGKVYQGGRSTLIGAPSPAIAAELDRLWRSEWRQNR